MMSAERPQWLTPPSSGSHARALVVCTRLRHFFSLSSEKAREMSLILNEYRSLLPLGMPRGMCVISSARSLLSLTNHFPSLSEIRMPGQRGRSGGCVAFYEKDGPGTARRLSAGARAGLPGSAGSRWTPQPGPHRSPHPARLPPGADQTPRVRNLATPLNH